MSAKHKTVSHTGYNFFHFPVMLSTMPTEKPKRPTPEEIAEFRASVRGIRLLTPKEVILRPKRAAAKTKLDEPVKYNDHNSEWLTEPDQVEATTILSFTRPGLQHKLLRKLRQGLIITEAELDLHGLNMVQAHHALHVFFENCQHKNLRWIRIIHGKGYRSEGRPILKNYVNQWLKHNLAVLGFHSANFRTGGVGAVNVLLKLRPTKK